MAEGNKMVMSTNGLRYVMPQPLSTTLVRTHKKQYSQRQTYSPGDTIVFDLNVSGQVDPEKSYLTFEVVVEAKGAGVNQVAFDYEGGIGETLGINTHQSALALIRDWRIQSKNGVELDRIQSLNVYSHIHNTMNFDNDWMLGHKKSLGIFQNFGESDSSKLVDGKSTKTVRFTIPCQMISGFFRPHVKGQKIPNHLLSGARVELQLESSARAFCMKGATGDSTLTYTVNNPQFVFMEHTLNDNTLKVLTQESANNGLEYVYDRVFTSLETTANQQVETQIKKAVSQGTAIVTAVYPAADQNLLGASGFKTHPSTILGSYQYRIASNYFPHQQVENASEAYFVSQYTFDGMRDRKAPAFDETRFNDGNFYVGVPLKSDHSISSSGLAINNSATAAFSFRATDTGNKVYYTFLVYTALARCFLSQVSVKV